MGQDLFSYRLLRWYQQHGRHQLPWQQQPTPYRVWVSEIMLQQTQVATVIPYYARFMQRFTDIQVLASATQDEVLQHWAGLGYYARGRNLHKAAQIVVSDHDGIFPQQLEQVVALPGIGRSTAGAILALSLNQRHPILDGNVKRSLCRYHGIEGFPGIREIESQLWALAEQHTPRQHAAEYTQAIMDMGAMLCTRSKPNCLECPHQTDCQAFQNDRVSQLPTPRPRKNKPKKQCYMPLLCDSDDRMVLFKRPSEGLWGGLYSLPEFDTTPDWEQFVQAGETQAHYHCGTVIKHSFTHFDLSIHPIYLRYTPQALDQFLNTLPAQLQHQNGVVFAQAKTMQYRPEDGKSPLALPAPVQRLITRRPLQADAYTKLKARRP